MRARRSPGPLRIALAGLLAAGLAGCGVAYDDMAQQRAQFARQGEGSIVLAAIQPPQASTYLDGVQLAVDEVNRRGGLLGRPLELLVESGAGDFDTVRDTVRRLAANPRVTAVLGHRSSSVAVPASVVYEQTRILFLPPFATVRELTLHDFDFVLRMQPENSIIAAQSASVAELLGHRRVAVLHSRDDYSRTLAYLFEDAAREQGLSIAFRGSFFQGREDYRGLLGQLFGADFDAVYLSTGAATAATIINQMRELSLEQPILGGDSMNGATMAQLGGIAADGLITPTVYQPAAGSSRNQRFVAAFRAAHDQKAPDQDAAQGYDSVHLLAAAIRRAGSTEPRVLATAAHYAPPFVGVTGVHVFDPRGNLFGKSYRFQVLRRGRWQVLPGVHAPYLLRRFRDHLAHAARQDPAADPEAGTAPELGLITGERLGRSQRLRTWLGLAHAILGFQRVGVVVAQDATSQAALDLLRSVGRERGFEALPCRLPAPTAAPQATASPAASPTARAGEAGDAGEPAAPAAPEQRRAQALLACYSRLANQVDAVYVVPLPGLAPEYLGRLNRVLRQYRIPSFALEPERPEALALTLALVGSGVDLDDPAVAQLFEGTLTDMKVHDLNRILANLPSVQMDLEGLLALGRRPPPEVLTLVSRVTEGGQEYAATTAEDGEQETRP